MTQIEKVLENRKLFLFASFKSGLVSTVFFSEISGAEACDAAMSQLSIFL